MSESCRLSAPRLVDIAGLASCRVVRSKERGFQATTAPNYLPWGGVHPGAAFFRDEVLPNGDVLNFL
jgi:hypothetical protein